jgi:hypothetical protein
MTDSITPPPELLDKWDNLPLSTQEIFVIAAQWSADQELEACCEWLDEACLFLDGRCLRAARRPKPPSLKEQALTELTRFTTGKTILTNDSVDIIRRALEALPE